MRSVHSGCAASPALTAGSYWEGRSSNITETGVMSARLVGIQPTNKMDAFHFIILQTADNFNLALKCLMVIKEMLFKSF